MNIKIFIPFLFLLASCSQPTEDNTSSKETPVAESSTVPTAQNTSQTVSTPTEESTPETENTEEAVNTTENETSSKDEKTPSKEVKKEVKSEVVEKTEPTEKTPETKVVKEEPVAVAKESKTKETVTTPKSSRPATPIKEDAFVFTHEPFDALLRKHVSSSGKVNYSGFKKDHAKLKEYLKNMSENPPKSWTRNREMAYWINAYNAHTIDLILSNYPVKSIKDLDGGNPWKVKRINIGGRKFSLNDIEKTQLISHFKEPRVHFAVNCAAKSCPPLLNKAWKEDNVRRYLDKQTRSFLNDTNQNVVSKKSLKLSKIFEWYAGDFGNKVIDFVAKYTKQEIKPNAKITYFEYDWSLNK